MEITKDYTRVFAVFMDCRPVVKGAQDMLWGLLFFWLKTETEHQEEGINSSDIFLGNLLLIQMRASTTPRL